MTPTGCICGGSRCCEACRAADRAAHVDRLRQNVVRTAQYCRRQGMSLPAELRDALDYLAIAERRAGGGR